MKAYTTRVGEGPYPTEIHGGLAEELREEGGEYGTTTGRPRRIGWLDIPALRFVTRWRFICSSWSSLRGGGRFIGLINRRSSTAASVWLVT